MTNLEMVIMVSNSCGKLLFMSTNEDVSQEGARLDDYCLAKKKNSIVDEVEMQERLRIDLQKKGTEILESLFQGESVETFIRNKKGKTFEAKIDDVVDNCFIANRESGQITVIPIESIEKIYK